jgi:hypothetical protein
MTPKKVAKREQEEFETLLPLLEALHEDIKELSRKSQNAPLSETKIRMINRLLARVKSLLQREASAEFLDSLDPDLIPQNADALLILGQYKAAMHSFRRAHATYDGIDESWNF